MWTRLAILVILASNVGRGLLAQTSAGIARHFFWGGTLPATCGPSTGDIFALTSGGPPITGATYYGCTAVNTWTALASVGSGITSLNGLVSSAQTFTNDANVTIVSSGSAHAITWSGTLSTTRGGNGGNFSGCTGILTFSGGTATCSGVTGSLGSVVLSVSPTFTGTVTMPAPTLNNVTGSTQCLQVNSSGVVSGSGAGCGGSGTINAAAQWDVPYYSASGSATTIGGTGINGIQFDSTSGPPTQAGPHNMATLLACADSSGSGTAQSCTSIPSFTPASGDTVWYKTTTSNTGDLTVNVNSSSAAHVRKWLGASVLASGDLPANTPVQMMYDGTYWEIMTIGNAPSGGGGSAFSAITGGTNTTATMTVGSGASIALSGSGTVAATSLNALTGMPSQSNATFLANVSGGSAAPTAATLPTTLNALILTSNANGALAASSVTDNGTTVSTSEALAIGVGSGNAGAWGANSGTQTVAAFTNAVGWIGPASAPSGNHFFQLPSVGAGANQFMLFGAESSNISVPTLTTLNAALIYGLWSGTCSSSTYLRGDGSCQSPSGSGTVTNFTSGNLFPLFTTSVATSTSTPALTFSLTNAGAGTVFGNNTGSSAAPAYTAAPVLGADNATAGTLQTANGSANAHTIWGSAATTSNTILGFATAPTTGHIVDCTVSSTTCTLHDSGVVTANVVNASSPGAGVAHFAGSTQTATSSAVALTDMATQVADTVVMNASGSTAAPTATAMPTCTSGADLYNTSTHAWSCVATGGGSAPSKVAWSPWQGYANGSGTQPVGGANGGSTQPFFISYPTAISNILFNVETASGASKGLLFGVYSMDLTTSYCISSVAVAGGSPDINSTSPKQKSLGWASGSGVSGGTCTLQAGSYLLVTTSDSTVIALNFYTNGGDGNAALIASFANSYNGIASSGVSTGSNSSLAFSSPSTATWGSFTDQFQIIFVK